MTSDELEFTISQYLDGSLPAAQAAELEALCEVDPAARQLLEEYRRLDDVLKQSPAAPELQWGLLAEHLSTAVTAEVERVEQVCVEYVDGTLASTEVAEFEARVAEDGRVRNLLEQHRRLRGALKALPQPAAVRWDKLADHLYATAVGEHRTIKLFAYQWMRAAGGLAVAACVLLASAIGLRHHLHGGATGHGSQPMAQVEHHHEGPAFASIEIGGADDAVADASKPAGRAVTEVSIGAGADQQPDAGGGSGFAGIVTTSSPGSLVATNAPPATAQDEPQMPY